MNKKKLFNVLISVFLSVMFFISSVPVKTQAAGTFNTYNNFEIDTSEYNVVWYPGDIYEVKYCNVLIGKVYVICGVATSKSNSRRQVLMVKTEMRPEDTKVTLLQYFHGVVESMQVTVDYGYHSDMEENQYAPVTTTVSGTKSTSSSIQVGANQKNGWNISGTLGCTYSSTYGDITVSANSKSSGRMTTQRSIKYYYDRENLRFNPIIQSEAKRNVNKALNADLIQTFAFEYTYTGTGKRPDIKLNLNAIFKCANNLSKTWYGDGSNICAGKGELNVTFVLGGQK